jgi:UPF0176 protein
MVGEVMNIEVSAFYKFVSASALCGLTGTASRLVPESGIKGTILLASEGINGTIAGEPAAFAA